jgi:hypothetical protein
LCSVKFVDRALATTVAVFLLGTLAGAFTVIFIPVFRNTFTTVIQVRMVSPIQTAARMGPMVLLFLVFLNNSIPAVLSFLYVLIVANVNWTPPLTEKRRRVLMSWYTHVTAFLTGFFGVGVTLGLAWTLEGAKATVSLMYTARIHGPLELFFVLVCIAEPLRLANMGRPEISLILHEHLALLWVSLIGLFVTAGIEVFTLF